MPLKPEYASEAAHAASMPWWKRTSSFIIIGTLFVLAWLGQAFSNAAVWLDDESDHGVKDPGTVWDAFRDADFWEDFWARTLENWQSEFLQVATWVLVGAIGYGLWKKFGGSSESKDSDERMEAKLDEIREHLGLK